MLVYGPSARGALRALAQRLGAQTLNDLPKPIEMGWVEFSLLTLDRASVTGTPVVFDLTHMENLTGVLAGHGQYAQTITGIELRYIRANWTRFAANVQFYENGARRAA
ncbi:MAG: hypothetical protein M3Y28_05530, partial [Armatimonadota bacterium]|nr:hypothetical protein [Armatimonadota bacterium]